MVGEAILNIGFAWLAESDEVRRDAMRYWCHQRQNASPYVRRGRVAIQKKRGQ